VACYASIIIPPSTVDVDINAVLRSNDLFCVAFINSEMCRLSSSYLKQERTIANRILPRFTLQEQSVNEEEEASIGEDSGQGLKLWP